MLDLRTGDALAVLATLPERSVQCVVTSPPYYGLRNYQVDGQIGLESSPAEYVAKLVAVFREVRRVLRDDGVVFLNLGDSYAGSWGNYGTRNGKQREKHVERVERNGYETAGYNACPPTAMVEGFKPKDLLGIPWRVAFALQEDGWWLRSDIVWHKPNPMPESVRDRPTKAHEYVFMLAKSQRYYFDSEAVKEPNANPKRASFASGKRCFSAEMVEASGDKHRGFGRTGKKLEEYINAGRNIRSVWTVTTQPCKEAHFAVMPSKLVEPCVKAGCPVGGTVLDPFSGAGTVAMVALTLGRNAIGIELNPAYNEIAERRIAKALKQMPLPIVT